MSTGSNPVAITKINIMYYALTDIYNLPVSTGLNRTSKEEVRQDLLSLIEPQVDDIEDYKTSSLEDLLIMEGLYLEESETSFLEPLFN